MDRRTALPALLAAAAIAVGGTGTAVAGHAAFTDSAGAHEAGIHWLSETGITGGCGGGRFCTDDAVKRGQMATFLHRFSGTGTVPPVVNADKVDGLDAEQLKGAAGPAGPAGVQGPAGAQGPAGPAGADAPSPFAVGRVLGPFSVPFSVARGQERRYVVHTEDVQVPEDGFYSLSARAVVRVAQAVRCDSGYDGFGTGVITASLPSANQQEQRIVNLGEFAPALMPSSSTGSVTVWLPAGDHPLSVVWFADTCSSGAGTGTIELDDVSLRLAQD